MTPTTCNPNVIDDFLSDRLSDDCQKEFEQHLDGCDACCAELQRRTAGVDLWQDARSILSSMDNIIDDLEPAPNGGTGARQLETTDWLRREYLNPTDDPQMLGRFGGYEISGIIGSGGMGVVLKGFDPALNRYAAIKLLAPHYACSGAARKRFAREAQAAAAVVHDNVIAIHGVSECNSLPYLVMPYIKGQSLQKRIDENGPMSLSEILRVGLQVAKGLAAAHDQGLVHRDIKPANILLPANIERVVITDFGLARAADDASLTQSGVIAGTPQYMSPEQACGESVGIRSDLFSLGSVMYCMCTGHPPFRAETAYGVLRRITDDVQRTVRELNPEVPVWLSDVIDRLLQKKAADRFRSAHEVAQLLEDCLAYVQQPTTNPLPDSLMTHRDRYSNRVVILGLVASLVLVVSAFLWSTGHPADEQAVPQASSVNVLWDTAPVEMTQSEDVKSSSEANTGKDQLPHWYPDDQLDDIEDDLNRLNAELSLEFLPTTGSFVPVEN